MVVVVFFKISIDEPSVGAQFRGLSFSTLSVWDEIALLTVRILCPCSSVVERILGKDEVGGSIPLEGSRLKAKIISQH